MRGAWGAWTSRAPWGAFTCSSTRYTRNAKTPPKPSVKHHRRNVNNIFCFLFRLRLRTLRLNGAHLSTQCPPNILMFKLLSSAGSFFFSCDGGLPRAPLFPRTSRLITTCDYIFRLRSIAIKKQKDDCIALIVSHLSWRDFQRWERVQAQRYYFEVFFFFWVFPVLFFFIYVKFENKE